MPSRILPLPTLPRGALGKVSRSDLARLAREALAADFEPPRGAAEAEVARIFADVLELPSVGRTDNFFQLGGDSLNAVRVLAAVESTFGVRLELDTLFDHPSVAEFAAAIRPGWPPLPEATAADGDHGKSTQPENTT
jgi:acyl carrier protein